MEEDPVTNLLRQHFKKVRECLQDEKNLDILTRFNFRLTTDKAIDYTDFSTEDEYANPELEFSQKTAGECPTVGLKSFSETSIDQIDSEEFLVETDFGTDSDEEKSILEASSSLCNAAIVDNERTENLQFVSSGKCILERPETPMLEMYDFDDDGEEDDAIPRRMQGSQKFILYPEQLQAGDLNLSTTNKCLSLGKAVDRSEILEILPRRQNMQSDMKVPTPEEIKKCDKRRKRVKLKHTPRDTKHLTDEKAFHKELEMYKRDIKLEKTIQSLSCDTNLPNQSTVRTQPQSGSSKTIHYGKEGNILENLKRGFNDSRLETTLGLDIHQKNISGNLKNYFEEDNTNVCQKVSVNKQPDEFHQPTESSIDDEIFEIAQDKISNTPSSNDDWKFSERNYFTMNHLEIQKEMMRRIEDMYKTGDGK